jgi:hypothetical protein
VKIEIAPFWIFSSSLFSLTHFLTHLGHGNGLESRKKDFFDHCKFEQTNGNWEWNGDKINGMVE